MFTSSQRSRVVDALRGAARGSGREARRAARILADDHKANAVADMLFRRFARKNPKASNGEIFKMVLDWISSGGLKAIAEFIAAVASLFI